MTTETILMLQPTDIRTGRNVRELGDKISDTELRLSIAERGILQPLIVRKIAKDYWLVSGHRRLFAAITAKMDAVPCIERELDDAGAAEVQLIENLQRADLHPLDEAEGFARLLSNGTTKIIDIASRVCKSETHVRQRLVLRNLNAEAKKMYAANQLSHSAAFLVARQVSEHQSEILSWLKRSDIAIAQLQSQIENTFYLKLDKAPFDTQDPKLLPKAGACTTCPKRSGNSPMLFPDVKAKETCTDSICYHAKEQALITLKVAANKDAIKLSANFDSWRSTKPLGEIHWAGAGKTKCKSLKKGVVIERGRTQHSGQDFSLGEVIEVCVNPRCEVHGSASTNGSSNGASRGKMTDSEKKARKKKRHDWIVNQQVHASMIDRLRGDAELVTDAHLRMMALEINEDYSFKHRAAVMAASFGLEPQGDTPYRKGADGQEKLGVFLGKAKRPDLLAFLACVPVTPMSADSDCGEMRNVAKRMGLNIDKIDKLIATQATVDKGVKKIKANGKGGRRKVKPS